MSIANVIAEGLDDVFARPFEVDMLAHSAELKTALVEHVSRTLKALQFDPSQFRPIQKILIPKRRPYKFRQCARIDPADAIAYLALVLLAAPQVEKQRLPFHKDIVFSYRYRPQKGYLFHPDYTYRSFLKHTNMRMNQQDASLLVACDIQGFYDRVDLTFLNKRLVECSVNEAVAGYLTELLMFWSNGGGHGLPIGSNASRILAEAVLIPIDRQLISEGIEFIRYVDDYRFFAPDARTANEWLATTLDLLSLYGFSANPSKTGLFDIRELLAKQTQRKWAQNTHETKNDDDDSSRRPSSGNERTRRFDTEAEPDALEEELSDAFPDEPEPADEDEISRLRKLNIERLYTEIEAKRIPKSKSIKDFIKAAAYRGDKQYVQQIPEVLSRQPQVTGFAVSTLIHTKEIHTKAIRRLISRRLSKILLSQKPPPEYVAVQILRLLGSPGYQNINALGRYFHGQGPALGTYRARAALEALAACGARISYSAAVRYYNKSDEWGKRAILRLICNHLDTTPFKPFFQKAVADARYDPITLKLVEIAQSQTA
jgi:hypothetical protein